MVTLYDCIVIGAGPAGITATVYLARKGLRTLVLTGDVGGQAAWSGDIANYTGYQFITGPELALKFEDHLRQHPVEIREGELVTALASAAGIHTVTTAKGSYPARTVIVASGKRARELGVPGEQEFKNKGVAYCATCDGPLFKGKEVIVVGGGNSAIDAALQLIPVAKTVRMVNNLPQLTGDAVMRDKLAAAANCTVHNASTVLAIRGAGMVTAVRVRTPAGEEEFPAQGVFIEIGLLPNSAFAAGLTMNAAGEIEVDCANRTNRAGVFAAGDVTSVPDKQIIIAAGEGAKAALGVFRYLMQQQIRPKGE